MPIIDKEELIQSLKLIDWGKFVNWGTVRVVVKKGQPVSFNVEETVKIE